MGNPFVHVELLAGDVGRAKEFYGKLFDWKIEDVPGKDYTMVAVADVSKTLEQAKRLGAQVMMERPRFRGWAGTAYSSTRPARRSPSGE